MVDVHNYKEFEGNLTRYYEDLTVNILDNIKLEDNVFVTQIGTLKINGNGKTIDGDNHYNIEMFNGVKLTWDNITITNCNSTGGALNILRSDATITNSIFNDNYNDGAAIYGSHSTIRIDNTTFNDNYAKYMGGAIYTSSSTLIIENSNMVGNEAINYGGAIYSQNSLITLKDSTFSKNNVRAHGGVLYAYDNSNVSVENCTFSDNEGPLGSSLVQYGGNLTVLNSTFRENYADTYGGVYVNNTNLTLKDTNFTKNRAGGASVIYSRYGNIEMQNCNVTENEGSIFSFSYLNIKIDKCNLSYNSGDYGAIMSVSYDTLVNITNSSIKGNKATYEGGVIRFTRNDTLFMEDCNVSNNEANKGGVLFVYASNQVMLKNVNLTENNAEFGGVIYSNSNGNNTIEYCNVSNNYAVSGGAIYGSITSLTINNSNFTDNYVTGTEGYVINLNATDNIEIIGNTFRNNTDDARDMLFSDAKSDANIDIHENNYIDNYLATNITQISNMTVNNYYNNTYSYPVNVTLRSIYNYTINEGVVFFKSDLIEGSNPVSDGESYFEIENRNLTEDVNNTINYNYTILKKDYQSVKTSFNIYKHISSTEINVTVLDDTYNHTKIKINLTSEDESPLANAPLTIALPD